MKKLFVVTLFISLLSLSGCHGIKKVTFEEFKVKAMEAVQNAPKVDYVTYKGKYGENRYKFSSNEKTSQYTSEELTFLIELSFIDSVKAMYSYISVNDSKFYIGMGFKVVNSGTTYEYTQKGYLAHIKGILYGKEFSFSASHKFI